MTGNAPITAKWTNNLSFQMYTLFIESTQQRRLIGKIKNHFGPELSTTAQMQQLFAYISYLGIWDTAKDLEGLDSCSVQCPTHCHHTLGFINRNFDVVTQRNVKRTWLASSK